MSQTSVQNFPLSHLEFTKDFSRSELSKDVLKSATLETLLSQHEETLNRLKVSLRRQSRLEDEIEQSRLQIESLKGQLAEREDYKAVEQEKHQLFAQRILELQEINDQLSALSKQQMEQIELLQSDKARNDKYHDKIKNQVRPYIEQLKAFSEQIQQKNKNLENQLNIKTVQINELKTQIDSLAENLQIQSVAQAQQNSELIQSYEAELEFKSSVIADLQNKITELTNQNKKLMQAFDRQVEVENQLIETQRLFETQKKNFEDEILRLQNSNNELNRNFVRSELERTDYHQRLLVDSAEIDDLKKKNLELQNQLESLRYMWNAKNEEAEKYKKSLESLEKLNIDLSTKIQEIRDRSNLSM